jgi:hypothetical protein
LSGSCMISGTNLKLAGVGQGKDGQTSVRVSRLWTENELRAFRMQGEFCYRKLMYVLKYVCMYLCTYVCTYVYVSMYAHTYVHM